MSTPTGSISIAGPSGDTSTVGQRPNEDNDVPGPDLVMKGSEDIAQTLSMDKMIVGVSGREIACKIYVRSGNSKGGKTNQSYDPDQDLPNFPIPLIPTTEEREGRAGTLEFLVVGLVLAKEPKKFSTTGTARARDKNRDSARKARGAMPSETNVLRALVPTTDSIDTGASIKYYVACNQLHGLCNLRLITYDTIFFFAEVWDEVGEVLLAKEKKTKIGEACKKLAARDKRPQQRTTVRIVKDNQTPSQSLQITRKTNAANVILMQYSLYTMSKKPEALQALKATLENLLPDLIKKPADKGVLAFYDFGEEFTEEDAGDVVESLKTSYPNTTSFNPQFIMGLHAALRRSGIGGDLPYQNLALFLRLSHAHAATTPGLSALEIEALVKRVVHDIQIVNEVTTHRTASEIADATGKDSLVLLLSGLRVALGEIASFLKDQATALRDQHGGINTHNSIDDIMTKIGDCVDKTALKSLMEQIFAIHAEQLATGNGNGVRYLDECIALIDQALDIPA